MTQCPECNHTNSSDARFCQKCGKKLVHLCRRCGAENLLGAQYCKSCGANLAEAKFSVSNDFAQKSWKNFVSFNTFKAMTSGNGWVINQIYPYAKQLLEARNLKDKSLVDEKMAFFLPITNRDWCISLLQFDKITVKYGAVWAGTSGFAIFDFDQRSVYFLPYKFLNSGYQKGDTVNLATNQGNSISMAIRASRPSEPSVIWNVLGLFWDLIGIFFSILNDILNPPSTTNNADRELERQRAQQDTKDREEQVRLADSYVESIGSFFFKIIEMKKEIDRT